MADPVDYQTWVFTELPEVAETYRRVHGREPAVTDLAHNAYRRWSHEQWSHEAIKWDIEHPGQPMHGPPTPPWATGERLKTVRANFCNLRDSKQRSIFTIYVCSLPDHERAEWYDIQRQAGSTHTVLAPDYSYHEGEDQRIKLPPPRQMLDTPDVFRAYVLEALNTRAADGFGFTPIIMLDEGHANPRDRIDHKWPALIEAIRDLLPYCLICPGWELVKASAWTSADLSYGLKKLKALDVPHIWLHLSIGRAAGSSNPIEADDPWQGAERDFWLTHGGEHIEGFLYQSQDLRIGDTIACDPNSDECWINRWRDVVPRIGNGMNGWRVMPLVFFEGPAYYFIREEADEAFAREYARIARDEAAAFGVSIGFGNGIPEE